VHGPRGSGKSMLFAKAGQVFYRFIQSSDEADEILMLPFNCKAQNPNFSEIVLLYAIIIQILFASIRYMKFGLLPFWLPFREWFLSVPILGIIGRIPNGMTDGCEFINPGEMAKLVNQLHNAFHRKTQRDELFQMILNLPNSLAVALKMKSGAFIIDALDVAPLKS
jgi:hypothetical protein